MNKRRGMARFLPVVSRFWLMAAVVFAHGCASEAVDGQTDDPSSDEATADLESREHRRIYTCTLAMGLVLGSLEVVTSSDAGQPTCKMSAPERRNSSRRYCQGPIETPPFFGVCPDCAALRRSLGCLLIP